MRFRRLRRIIAAIIGVVLLPAAAVAQQRPLQTNVVGTVLTYELGWNHAWITACPQQLKIGQGVLGGVRNVATVSSAVTWSMVDQLNLVGSGPILDIEPPGLDGGKIVTLSFPGIAFSQGLVFTCSAPLPTAPTGAPGSVEVFFR